MEPEAIYTEKSVEIEIVAKEEVKEEFIEVAQNKLQELGYYQGNQMIFPHLQQLTSGTASLLTAGTASLITLCSIVGVYYMSLHTQR